MFDLLAGISIEAIVEPPIDVQAGVEAELEISLNQTPRRNQLVSFESEHPLEPSTPSSMITRPVTDRRTFCRFLALGISHN